MTNSISALVLITLVTNAPITNYQPSMREIEVVTVVKQRHVITYTNDNMHMVLTNEYRFLEVPEKFVLKEEWVKAPSANILRPPPLPQNR